MRIPMEGCPDNAPKIRVNIINTNLDRESLQHLRNHPRIGKRNIYRRQGEQEDFMMAGLGLEVDGDVSDGSRDQNGSDYDSDEDEDDDEDEMFGMGGMMPGGAMMQGGGAMEGLLMQLMGLMGGGVQGGPQGVPPHAVLQQLMAGMGGAGGEGSEGEDEESESEWEEASEDL